tara:strand:- start:1078 stop:1689 length:612 start_codon:yes stop_codon:yes gene_type:complete
MVEGTKMSKSLGNLYTLDDIRARGHTAEEVRYVLLSGSYRQPLNFTFDSLKAAGKALKKISDFSSRIEFRDEENRIELATRFGPFQAVQDAILNDLNTADALGKLFGLMRELSEAWDKGDFQQNQEAKQSLHEGFRAVLDLFGFSLKQKVQAEVPEDVLSWAKERWEAKQSKDWVTADLFRDKIQQAGWIIKDSKDTYELSKS